MSGIIPPEFKITIPSDRVALYPSEKRGNSKLLVIDRKICQIVHVGNFLDIKEFLSDELIVVNETRVLPARVFGHRVTGGAVELLFMPTTIEPISSDSAPGTICISALISTSRRPGEGTTITLPDGACFVVEGKSVHGGFSGLWTHNSGEDFQIWLERNGVPPLPPYIKRPAEISDRERYQTVYAKIPGSIAAPTAGLHFTPELLAEIETRGAEVVRLTLDVGWGTFQPIKTENIGDHVMHRESYLIPPATAEAINRAAIAGRNILAVGTTSVRALEAAASVRQPLEPGAGEASIFIYPPYQFRIVGKLLTNFHRPDSTLLHLVAAMTGWDLLNEAYQRALDEDFRFFSYGDAMLIV